MTPQVLKKFLSKEKVAPGGKTCFQGSIEGAPGFLPLLGVGEKKAPSGKLPGGSLVTPKWSKKILSKEKVAPGGKTCFQGARRGPLDFCPY